MIKNPLPMQEMLVQSMGQEDLLEKEMATHSSIVAWRNPWPEEPDRLWFIGLQRPYGSKGWTQLKQLSTQHAWTDFFVLFLPFPNQPIYG